MTTAIAWRAKLDDLTVAVATNTGLQTLAQPLADALTAAGLAYDRSGKVETQIVQRDVWVDEPVNVQNATAVDEITRAVVTTLAIRILYRQISDGVSSEFAFQPFYGGGTHYHDPEPPFDMAPSQDPLTLRGRLDWLRSYPTARRAVADPLNPVVFGVVTSPPIVGFLADATIVETLKRASALPLGGPVLTKESFSEVVGTWSPAATAALQAVVNEVDTFIGVITA
jgi:hypothetical protein